MSAALFVDGAALRIGALQIGIQIDFARLRSWAAAVAKATIVEAYWFDATDTGVPTSAHRALRVSGYRTRIHEIQEIPILRDGRRQYDRAGTLIVQRKQVGVDVALACELLASHSRCRWDTLILVAGDGDLVPPLQQLVEQSAIRVILVGSQRARSHRLVPWVEVSIDLNDIANDVGRLAPALAAATGTEQISA
jgi:uncharacterized LabA/DUF88 family protein